MTEAEREFGSGRLRNDPDRAGWQCAEDHAQPARGAFLYQVWSLIQTIDDCFKPGSSITIESLLHQTDQLILDVVKALEDDRENEIVRRLLTLRRALELQEHDKEWTNEIDAARVQVINIVNNFFYDKLTALPTIKKYIDVMAE